MLRAIKFIGRLLKRFKEEAFLWIVSLSSVMPGATGRAFRTVIFRHQTRCDCLGINVAQFVNVNGWSNITIGDNVSLGLGSFIESSHGKLVIGNRVSISARVFLGSDQGRITIGDDCLIGPNTVLRAANHRFDKSPEVTIREQGHESEPIILGNDVWLGSNVVITPGCVIGDHVIIGAGAVVTSDIPSRSIAVGVPARVISSIDKTKIKSS